MLMVEEVEGAEPPDQSCRPGPRWVWVVGPTRRAGRPQGADEVPPTPSGI